MTAPEPVQFSAAALAQMERLLDDFRQMVQERNEALQEVARAHHDVLMRLALAADYRDDETGVHIMRIAFLAEALALRLGQPNAFATLLRQAAPMHDVGKIGTPDRILKKPGPLTPEEREVMNRHAAIGAEILGRSRIPLFRLAADVARTHHERWDGSGYPRGLSGESIPLGGRIVAVVDFFDALTMDRVYRRAFPDAQALAMLAEQRGAAFDPQIVDCFLAHAGEFVALRDAVNRRQPTFTDLLEGFAPATKAEA